MPSRFLAGSVILAAFALVACSEADSSTEVQADAAWIDTGPDASNASDTEGGPDAPDAAACENKFEGLSPLETSCAWVGERGPMHDVWGASPTDFYAVGRNGVAMHYDGSCWTPLDLGTYESLFGVWGTSASNVFIAGRNWVYRFDGNTWRRQQIDGHGLSWISGLSECSVFGSGEVGSVHHFDGTSWSRFPTPGPEPGSPDAWSMKGVWGTSDSNLYLIANADRVVEGEPYPRGKIAHYDGVAWTIMLEDAGPRLQQIWAAGPDDIYVAGGFNSESVILHFDGAEWSTVFSDMGGELSAIWGRSGNDVYAAGLFGRVLHYDGVAWSELGALPESRVIRNLSGSGDKLWLAADSGILELEGDQLSFAVRWPINWSIEALGGCAPTDVFAVGIGPVSGTGSQGLIVRREGTDWNPMQIPSTGSLHGVWCSSPGDVFAVGADSTVLHYDGSGWTKLSLPVAPGWLNGVWASSPSEVFVVGENGSILRGDGNQWEVLDSGTHERLRAVWGTSPIDVYAAGDGVLLHYDGKVWSKEASAQIRSLWGADKDNVFAAAQGSILRREGTVWVKAHEEPYSAQLGYAEYWGIAGSSASELFAVGSSTVTQLQGGKYETASDFPNALRSVWFAGPGSALAAGGPNMIRYRCSPDPR